MHPLQERVTAAYQTRYGKPPEAIIRAPGRVNLIGEHTDYNDGFVLPVAIDRAVFIAAGKRSDKTVNVHSLDFKEDFSFTAGEPRGDSPKHWADYIRGVFWLLQEQGYKLGGLDLATVSDVPIGAGLSSSAATELGSIETLEHFFDLSIPQQQKALLGVEVEHQYIGVPCGIMDQTISALGVEGHALLIDCRSLQTTPVPIPSGVSILVMDTRKSRGLVDSEYALRRQQCEEAAHILGVKALRDVPVAVFEVRQGELPEVHRKRVRHVVTEDARTLQTVDMLRNGQLKEAGQMLNESHSSLRDDYEVSCRELDVIVALTQAQPGVYGARMTGGGFGGCAVALVEDEAVDNIIKQVLPAYKAQTGLDGQIYVCRAASGSGVVSG